MGQEAKREDRMVQIKITGPKLEVQAISEWLWEGLNGVPGPHYWDKRRQGEEKWDSEERNLLMSGSQQHIIRIE